MRKNRLFYSMRKVLILSASFLLAFQACKKDGELVPEFEENTTFSYFSNSTNIQTVTRRGERVLADKIAVGLVGEYRDSSFGYSKSTIHIQPILSSNDPVFEGSNEVITVDSVILSLEYGGHFGDTSVAQTFEVHRIDETLYIDSNDRYFSDYLTVIQPAPLATINFTPQPTTRRVIIQPNNLGDTASAEVNPQLRINLGNDLGNEIVGKQGGEEVLNSMNFVNYFKGLQISAVNNTSLTDNQAAILYFRLTASNTKMTIYYTAIRETNLVFDTLQRAADFPVSTGSVRFNTFEHDYSGSAAESALQNQDSSFGYVQAMAGLETVIKFPDLKDEFAGKLLINKAELIIPAANGSYSIDVGKAEKLIVAERDNDQELKFIPDFDLNSEFFGGEFDESKNEYKFNISRYIQSYLNGGQTENGLTLLVSGSAVKADRAVILTGDNTDKRVKLNLYYTNIQ
ncbi:MAG: hypothetical protein ACI91R_000835 [Vicingaceae bacterium]|jgi:hypothetical protein